jgi:hypothetical protein
MIGTIIILGSVEEDMVLADDIKLFATYRQTNIGSLLRILNYIL